MRHFFFLLTFVVSTSAVGISANHVGRFRVGLNMGFGSANPNGKSVSIQSLEETTTFQVSHSTSFHLKNAISVQDAGAGFFGTALNDNAYFSAATLGRGGSFQISNLEAKIQYELDEQHSLSLGHGATGFGMENRDTLDQLLYYSNTRNVAYSLGWMYNIGLNWKYISEILRVEASLFETTFSTKQTPGVSFRVSGRVDGGDWSVTPSASGYFGRWHGSPEDIGASAGMEFSMAPVKLVGEFILVFTDPTPDSAENTFWSIYAMPVVDVGLLQVGTKIEYATEKLGASAIQNTVNFSLLLAKDLSAGSQLGLQYYHTGTGSINSSPLGGRLGSNGNDLRFLFSQKW